MRDYFRKFCGDAAGGLSGVRRSARVRGPVKP